jgi:hypothetical protein
MTGTQPSVLIMAKAPRSGAVKTRLAPLLASDDRARLQARMIRHTAAHAHQVAPGSTYLAFDPPHAAEEIERLLPSTVLFPQVHGHLGNRMAAATRTVLARRPGPLLVIGTDAPTLTSAMLHRAARALDHHDVVFGPALDGGYYLVGLRRPQTEVFAIDPVLWGGSRVLAASRDSARRAGLTVGSLPVLRDLDTPEDAVALRTDPLCPPAIAALLAPGGD